MRGAWRLAMRSRISALTAHVPGKFSGKPVQRLRDVFVHAHVPSPFAASHCHAMDSCATAAYLSYDMKQLLRTTDPLLITRAADILAAEGIMSFRWTST